MRINSAVHGQPSPIKAKGEDKSLQPEEIKKAKIEKAEVPAPSPKIERKKLSAQEIRDKVSGHFNKGKGMGNVPASDVPPGKAARPLSREDLKELQGPSENEENAISVNSIIQKNSPNDPATIKKLQDALSSGVVSFSEKEQSILNKLINDR